MSRIGGIDFERTQDVPTLGDITAARQLEDTNQQVQQPVPRSNNVSFTSLYSENNISWQNDANCLGVDPDLFFPERGASVKEAKEVCRGCMARLACLEFALVNGEKFGIWGGLSERERRHLRRQRVQSNRRTAEA
jgi:WhiB family redox-sensing transcriptional regulator